VYRSRGRCPDIDTTIVELYICDSAVFCALHDQLASLDRHALLTRCFSAVAELLVCSFFFAEITNCLIVSAYITFYSKQCFISSLGDALKIDF